MKVASVPDLARSGTPRSARCVCASELYLLFLIAAQDFGAEPKATGVVLPYRHRGRRMTSWQCWAVIIPVVPVQCLLPLGGGADLGSELAMFVCKHAGRTTIQIRPPNQSERESREEAAQPYGVEAFRSPALDDRSSAEQRHDRRTRLWPVRWVCLREMPRFTRDRLTAGGRAKPGWVARGLSFKRYGCPSGLRVRR